MLATKYIAIEYAFVKKKQFTLGFRHKYSLVRVDKHISIATPKTLPHEPPFALESNSAKNRGIDLSNVLAVTLPFLRLVV